MILSMTGYGEASAEIDNKTYRIEIKSLNGKNVDIRFKTNSSIKDKELVLRKIIADKAMRGKFDVNLVIDSSSGEEAGVLNQGLLSAYLEQLIVMQKKHNLGQADLIQAVLRLPNVVMPAEEDFTDRQWIVLEQAIIEAVDKLNNFRVTEGASMKKDLEARVSGIEEKLSKVPNFEEERLVTIKKRIQKNLNQFGEENIDQNRFEQELLFYIEKLDINEEKVRLDQHCKFFLEELRKEKPQKGKKLSFISQEMGREINTLGAKAQHSEIQQLVVGMKDELEKIKELILNVL